MMYKVGDRVEVDTLESIQSKCTQDNPLITQDGCIINNTMLQRCGKVVTIQRTIRQPNRYYIKDDGIYVWPSECFKGKIYKKINLRQQGV